MTLTETQKQLYIRNIILPEINEFGQEKLLAAKVLVIGAGGLGSAVLYYLAAAGIGNIGIVDDDIVELSNLQRQIIHNTQNLGQKKASSAQEKIFALNKNLKVSIYESRATLDYLAKIANDYDYILDATDNFQSRFIINKFCVEEKKTLIFAAVKGFLGQISVFDFSTKNNSSPCYACFNTNVVDDNFSLPLSEKGILGSVAGSIGAIQASTTIKEILQIGESLVGKILIFDFLKNNFRKTSLKKNYNCNVCGNLA